MAFGFGSKKRAKSPAAQLNKIKRQLAKLELKKKVKAARAQLAAARLRS